jgi:hypothetical protein
MPYCGNQWVAPGTVCPDGSTPTEKRGGAPASPPAGQQQVVTGKQPTPPPPATTPSTSRPPGGRPKPPQADTSPVVTGMKPPRPGMQPEVYSVSDVYTERQNLNTIRVTNPRRYNRIVSELRATGLLGPRANSESAIDRAWNKLLQAASGSYQEGMAVTPQQARNIIAGGDDDGPAGGGRSGRGGAGGYSGPTESVVRQSETDIIAMAQDAAQALLGRMPTQKEIDKILRRTRKAEMAEPQVTRREGPGRTVTDQGLTKEGRDQILRQVLMQSPDYQNYQIDSVVMDMMLNNLRRGQEVARGA